MSSALEFYTGILGFDQVRSTSLGVVAAVVQAAPGQQIELVEGGTARPDTLVFQVEDIQRWKEHFGHVGVTATSSETGLDISDPDGLVISLESL